MLAVVTGADEVAAPVVAELESSGAQVLRHGDDLAPDQHVNAYVQLPKLLPTAHSADDDSLVEKIGRFLSNGLLERFQEAAGMLPHLTGDATVVLVGGNTPIPGTAADDKEARMALLRVLAHALRAEEAPRHLRVRVLGPDSEPGDVAKAVTDKSAPRQSTSAAVPEGDSDVDMSYQDWRTQIIGLANVAF